MASKIMASVSMARLSLAVFGMPNSADRMIFGALGAGFSAKRSGIIGSPGAWLPGMTGGPKRPMRSSASRRNISCSRADWLSRLAAAPLPAGARPAAGARLAASACCRACSALLERAGGAVSRAAVGLSGDVMIAGWAALTPARSSRSFSSA